jgi:hypothetical protein
MMSLLDCRRSKMKWSVSCVKIEACAAMNIAGMVRAINQASIVLYL